MTGCEFDCIAEQNAPHFRHFATQISACIYSSFYNVKSYTNLSLMMNRKLLYKIFKRICTLNNDIVRCNVGRTIFMIIYTALPMFIFFGAFNFKKLNGQHLNLILYVYKIFSILSHVNSKSIIALSLSSNLVHPWPLPSSRQTNSYGDKIIKAIIISSHYTQMFSILPSQHHSLSSYEGPFMKLCLGCSPTDIPRRSAKMWDNTF